MLLETGGVHYCQTPGGGVERHGVGEYGEVVDAFERADTGAVDGM